MVVVAEIAGGCTRFFLFPSPFPPSSPPPSDTSLSASGSSLSRVVLVSDGRRCMKATRGVRDDTFVLPLLCAIGPPPPPSGASQAGREPRSSAPQRGRSVGRLVSWPHAPDGSVPAREWQQQAGGAPTRSWAVRLWPARCGLGRGTGRGDGQGPRDGPGRLRAIETAGPPRLDGAGDRLIGTTAKRFPNEA